MLDFADDYPGLLDNSAHWNLFEMIGMSEKLSLASLGELIKKGEIDTVLVCFPDMQGRLIGKRVVGRFFMDAGHKELHVCDYLLALDMDMEPVPGYASSSWDKGYGDFTLKADLETIRDSGALEKLTDSEREACEALWADYRTVLDKLEKEH